MIRLKEADPALEVAVLEKDFCGSGASGRNGGFALSYWPKIASLVKLLGEEQALRVVEDSVAAIKDIHRLSQELNTDIQFRASGWIWAATSEAQRGGWNSVVQLTENRFRRKVFERLSPEELHRRTGSDRHLEGVFDASAAMLHPARYVRLLRDRALQLGVQIFENTWVRDFTRTNPVRLTTEKGSLVCERLVVATNAWAAALPEFARRIVPITSDMVMTAPAPDDLHCLGWTGGEGITDSQTMVDYYQATPEGRIAFGKGGLGIAYGGNLGSDFDRNTDRAKVVEADFRRYYPQLAHVRVTHDWCGPIDRTPNSLPLLGRLPKSPQIVYGIGWSGNGVAPSVLGGRILASFVLDRKDEWALHPLVGRSVGLFPPEPIRFWGAHVVRAAVAAKEAREIENQKPSWMSVQIAKLAPAGLEDKEV